MKSHIRIGTRGSALAMYQAVLVESKLKHFFPMLSIEIIKIKTKGDMIRRGGLSAIGRGIFTREIEEALLRNEVDLAVHSGKDLESELPNGLELGAILEREDSRDCLIATHNRKMKDFKPGAKIGTSSLRRKAQLKRLNPRFEILDLRGNVDSRVKKVQAGEYDGIVLAAAGVNRLGLKDSVSEILDSSQFLPQAAQGAIAVEIRVNDPETKELVSSLNHEESFVQVRAERSFLRALHGGCQVPIGIASRLEQSTLSLEGAVFSLDGSQEIRNKISGLAHQAEILGKQLAGMILDSGGDDILREVRAVLEK